MNQDLELLIEFVSGDIDGKTFETKLYASSSIEELLADDPTMDTSSYIGGDNYLFLISLDYNDLGNILNAQSAIEQFLERKNIAFSKSEKSSDIYDLILQAQPKWLDVESKYISEKYLDGIDGLSKKEAIVILRTKILNDFKYIKSTPKWIQSPAWPIINGVPLVFLGQMKIDNYFHDTASAYLFYSPESGNTETVIQVF